MQPLVWSADADIGMVVWEPLDYPSPQLFLKLQSTDTWESIDGFGNSLQMDVCSFERWSFYFAMTLLNFRHPQKAFLSELESLPGEDLRQRFACGGTVTSGRGKKSVKHILSAWKMWRWLVDSSKNILKRHLKNLGNKPRCLRGILAGDSVLTAGLFV